MRFSPVFTDARCCSRLGEGVVMTSFIDKDAVRAQLDQSLRLLKLTKTLRAQLGSKPDEEDKNMIYVIATVALIRQINYQLYRLGGMASAW